MQLALLGCGSNVSTHSRPKAAGDKAGIFLPTDIVSTHSRPKAAGYELPFLYYFSTSFNTQPPEGGWAHHDRYKYAEIVSTHSRPKAAGSFCRA